MTKDETTILAEVANDVKWLKRTIEENAHANTCEHGRILEHLAMLNGKVESNRIRSIINRYGITINLSILLVIITILLHVMGIY